jgi:AP-3 complex subunit delta-1
MKHVQKGDGEALMQDLPIFFNGDLNPVASKAQKKVPVPEGLDLDSRINEPIQSDSESSGEETINDNEVFVKSSGNDISTPKHKRSVEPSPKELQRHRELRLLQQQQDPNYLKQKSPTTPNKTFQEDEVPINTLDFGGVTPLLIPGLATTEQYFDLNSSVEHDKSNKHGQNIVQL